jgi:N-acetylneuraminic acid mutarotase
MRPLSALLLLAIAPTMTLVWMERKSMARPEAGGAAGFLDGDFVVAGGTTWDGDTKLWLKDVQIYAPTQNTWRSGPALPVPLAYAPFVSSADGLEIFGGTDGRQVHRESWKLDRSKSAWHSTGALAADALLGRAARIGDSVFILGGCPDVVDLAGCSDSVWRRDASGPWRRVSSLPGGALALTAIAVARNRIFVFGGCSMPAGGALVNRSAAYSYDPQTNVWATLRELPTANRGASAVAIDDRSIMIFGGFTASAEEAAGKSATFGFSAQVLVYDIANNSYKPVTPLPAPLLGVEFVMSGRTLYGAGGEDRMRGRSARLLETRLAEPAP